MTHLLLCGAAALLLALGVVVYAAMRMSGAVSREEERQHERN